MATIAHVKIIFVPVTVWATQKETLKLQTKNICERATASTWTSKNPDWLPLGSETSL